MSLDACGVTRLLVPAFVVGLVVATLAANDGYGWIAAAMTVGVLAGVRKLRGTSGSCPLPAPIPVDTTDERARPAPPPH